MKKTFTLDLLSHLLSNLDDAIPRKSNYTAKGCETVVEYRGTFYRITVEAMEETHERNKAI